MDYPLFLDTVSKSVTLRSVITTTNSLQWGTIWLIHHSTVFSCLPTTIAMLATFNPSMYNCLITMYFGARRPTRGVFVRTVNVLLHPLPVITLPSFVCTVFYTILTLHLAIAFLARTPHDMPLTFGPRFPHRYYLSLHHHKYPQLSTGASYF